MEDMQEADHMHLFAAFAFCCCFFCIQAKRFKTSLIQHFHFADLNIV